MNNLEIGKKIKYLRKGKGVTQEALANYLGVTTQAVSKWENEATAPDISLLPNISVYFGVTIDELFSLTDDAKLDRIDHMLDNKRYTSKEEFYEAENFLKEFLENQNNSEESRVKAYEILTWLYIHKSEECKERATFYGKEGIKLAPLSKSLHKGLNNAHVVPLGDWNIMNHRESIDYYKAFIKEQPNHRTGYMYLLDALINDGRLEEARAILKEYERIADDRDWRTTNYRGLIELEDGNKNKANEILNEMLERYPNVEGPHFERGVIHAYSGQWEEAMNCFEKDFELMEKPRYTDALSAIAQIYEIKGDNPKAIETYQRYIQLLEKEWEIKEGETMDYPIRQIQRLGRESK